MSLIPIESFSAHLFSGDGPSFEIFSSYTVFCSVAETEFSTTSVVIVGIQ
jgi:hypothetical protein